MWYLLAFAPWVLTTVALLIILVRKYSKSEEHYDDDFNDEDYPFLNSKEVVRVAVYDDKAYWVYDNVFYQAEVTREPDFSTAEPIDTMSMNPKELNKLLTILDDLEEDKNERE